ncbi:hypothetical protein A1O1_05094 [Capronia coronata CBS 617.96]|uniref:Uncharacterized protein n=1 Tax=Capronia coronata CBS 617.96 TaxID=1182541 RepID=W9YFY0_9EURO|nr:uncharacterized protein A1O1_05094 [Capronia coronata CBS 617.96]EXJ88166.1 hypothetical protein A1O1_05094 [Capronia coronata CBS 617.96]
MQSLLKMFNLSNAPTVPLDEEELSGEADEPPDDQICPLNTQFSRDGSYSRSMARTNSHRESLLTRAIMAESKTEEPPTLSTTASRGLSTTSSRSTGSMASTAELTSDGDATSPSRSATPSPPPPPGHYTRFFDSNKEVTPTSKVVIAPMTKDDKPAVADVGEAAIEKTLGRKRCIMFACGGTDTEKSRDNISPVEPPVEWEVPKRKCMLTFACPTKTNSNEHKPLPSKLRVEQKASRRPSPAPAAIRKSASGSADLSGRSVETAKPSSPYRLRPNPPVQKVSFHEFGSSHDETDAWVDKPSTHKTRLTLDDCMQKELRIRDIGREAEEEAEEEEREQEELEAELEDNDNEDDFAPSDNDSASDGGNESDDEGGFASSDDESDAGSEYQFWAPSANIARGSMEHMHLRHFSSRQQSPASSIESMTHSTSPPLHFRSWQVRRSRRQPLKVPRLRPGTPELPDSTDFVCGTLDEDRPLEAAYISCREQKKRAKHIPIPQDIDPSFPTTDPDEEQDECDDQDFDGMQDSSSDAPWLKDQFTVFDNEARGRRKSPVLSPQHHSPPSHVTIVARPEHRRAIHRSPPPPKHIIARSPPPPRKLFGQSPTRFRSPPPPARLRSPRGSPTHVNIPSRMGTRGLGQRPTMERTASLPDTPNPFFRNFNIGSPSISNIASGAVTPMVEGPPRLDMHVRGPVDIVMGLEKKRQKRKEKFLRQHCRKVREQTERRPTRGRGAERMKELGLECAERLKGYGIGQQTQLVLSL